MKLRDFVFFAKLSEMTNFVDGSVSTVTSSQTKMENKKFKNKKLPTLTDIAPLTAEQSPRKKIEKKFTKFHKNSQKFFVQLMTAYCLLFQIKFNLI